MNKTALNNPHDYFFRRTFDVEANVRLFLRELLPRPLTHRLRLDQIVREHESFLAPGENENRLDLLYSTQLEDGTPVLVYVLLEHKSWIDRTIALQLLAYVLRIQQWRQRNGLPPCLVIPVVIYQGVQPWDEPTSLRKKVVVDAELKVFLPDMEVIFIDLQSIRPEELGWSVELQARIRIMQWVRQLDRDFEQLTAIISLWRKFEESHSLDETMHDIVVYVYSIQDAETLEKVEQAIVAGLLVESEGKMPTALDAFINRERGIGRQEGRQEGCEQGELIGRITAFQQVLRQTVTPKEELSTRSLAELQSLATQLTAQLQLQ
jgi:predicted transposase/invertase (TIGR01784 family)